MDMAYNPKNNTERVIHRYKISLGQLKKVIAMIEGGEYCIHVISQSQAVQKALAETNNLLLENHLKTCAARSIKSGRGKKAIAEIMEVFRKKS